MTRKDFKILDIGCGNNSAIKTKKYFPKCKYYGLDMNKEYNNSKDNFELMERFFEENLETSDLSNLPDNYFDAIILSHVIEHLTDGEEVLRKLCSKLKIGGVIYIETPHENSLNLPNMNGTLNFSDDLTHVRLYSINEISNILLKLQFNLERAGIRRNIYRIVLTPFLGLFYALQNKSIAGVIWDITGFAFFVIAKKKDKC